MYIPKTRHPPYQQEIQGGYAESVGNGLIQRTKPKTNPNSSLIALELFGTTNEADSPDVKRLSSSLDAVEQDQPVKSMEYAGRFCPFKPAALSPSPTPSLSGTKGEFASCVVGAKTKLLSGTQARLVKY